VAARRPTNGHREREAPQEREEERREHVSTAPARRLGVQSGRFRTGQWVRVKGVEGMGTRTGIHVRAVGLGTAEVHVVDKNGDTQLVLPEHPVANLEEARLNDIPEKRRPRQHPLYQ
jgi:hypothetical protein